MDKVTSAQVREQLLESATKLRTLRELPADKRTDTYERDVRSGIMEINALDAEHKAALLSETPERSKASGPSAAFDSVERYKSPGQTFVEGERGSSIRNGRDVPIQNGLRALLDSGTDSGAGPAAGLFAPVGQPLAPQVRQRRLFVRDLISVQSTGLNLVPYILEKNVVTNELGANVVAEGAAKPEVTLEFEQADAPIRKIAGWLPITDEIASDAPTLSGYINTRLGYMIAIREEQQLINGSGTAPQLRGIRNFTGVQTQAAQYKGGAVTAGTPVDVPATVGLALGKVEAVDGDADGVVMHPTDFWEGLTMRYADQFDGGTSFGGPAVTVNPRNLWGVPVVTTRAATVNEALVGSYKLGATLFDRQQTIIKTSDNYADYFVSNKLVVLAEERIGLGVHRPDFFVKADLAPHA